MYEAVYMGMTVVVMCLVTVFRISSIKGNGYGSFLVAAFSIIKYVHIFNLPLFLGIIMGDNHVVSSTY